MAQDDAIVKLARQIDAARKADRFVVNEDEVAGLRRDAACGLHRICTEFARSVNSKLAESSLDVSPSAYCPESFREAGTNLIQIASQGREMQFAFESTRTPFSTEKFLVPYILEGEIRAYNQKMLERFEIRTRLLFYCVSEVTSGWRFFDWRTRHTGAVDGELLAKLMAPLF